MLLRSQRDGRRQVVGGVILELPAAELTRLRSELLDAVANALDDRCVTTATESLFKSGIGR